MICIFCSSLASYQNSKQHTSQFLTPKAANSSFLMSSKYDFTKRAIPLCATRMYVRSIWHKQDILAIFAHFYAISSNIQFKKKSKEFRFFCLKRVNIFSGKQHKCRFPGRNGSFPLGCCKKTGCASRTGAAQAVPPP